MSPTMNEKERRSEGSQHHPTLGTARPTLGTGRLIGVLACHALSSFGCGELEIGSYGEGGSGPAASSGPMIVTSGGASGAFSSGNDGGDSGGDAGASGRDRGAASGGDPGMDANGGAGPVLDDLRSVDVGDTGAPGKTVLDEDTYVIDASGADIEGGADSFRFLYQGLSGDGQIVARIEDVTPTRAWTKVGVMVRDSLAPESKNAFLLLRPSEGSAFQHRPETGGGTTSTWQETPADFTPEHNVRYLRPPKWLKLTRLGDVFTAYSSDDGECWWRRWSQTIPFDDGEALFGVALSSGGYGDLATARVTNLDVEGTVDPHNAACPRAQIDGELPLPDEAHWLVPPARFASAGWDFTTTNPNGTALSKCDPNAEDVPPGTEGRWPEIAPRTDGPDHPNCPDPGASPAWTKLEFEPNASWLLDQPAGIGFAGLQASDKLSTYVNARGLWLRKVFEVTSHSQKNDLMLWGRWSDGITVYVNGVLATSNSLGTDEYRYLGLSDEARAALVVGASNVVAVRLEWDRQYWHGDQVLEGDAWDRFFDLGLTTESRIAHVPLEGIAGTSASTSVYVETVKKFVEERGIPGATFAVSKGGEIVASVALGWRNKNMDERMLPDARLRLASNDEVVTQAVIAKLVNDGVIEPSEPVFPRLGLEPIPGRSPGANVNQITVEHLRTHTSGIGATLHHQQILDEVAFEFGISPDQWTKEHTARWLSSLDATNVGSASGSTRDAYFLLRYLAERLIAPRTLEQYLAEDMGLDGITVSHERMTGREPHEGYVTSEPTWDRWLALEGYLSLGASARAYASFFDRFALGYELTPEGRYAPAGGGVVVATMPGTWSVALVDPFRALSLVMITNTRGNFEDVIDRLNRITYEGSPCLFGPEPPLDHPERFHFIQNLAVPDHYIHLEHGLAASPAVAGWWSAQWQLVLTGDARFHLKNRWTEEYLYVEGGQVLVGAIDPGSGSAEWRLVPAGQGFLIQNTEGQFLSLEDGMLSARVSEAASNAQWAFCN